MTAVQCRRESVRERKEESGQTLQKRWPQKTTHAMCMLGAKSLQLSPTLCDSMNCMEPTKAFCPWDSPGKNTGVDCHFLLHGIFPTQGSTLCLLCLLNCRQILYH